MGMRGGVWSQAMSVVRAEEQGGDGWLGCQLDATVTRMLIGDDIQIESLPGYPSWEPVRGGTIDTYQKLVLLPPDAAIRA